MMLTLTLLHFVVPCFTMVAEETQTSWAGRFCFGFFWVPSPGTILLSLPLACLIPSHPSNYIIIYLYDYAFLFFLFFFSYITCRSHHNPTLFHLQIPLLPLLFYSMYAYGKLKKLKIIIIIIIMWAMKACRITAAMGLYYYGLRDTTATYATNFLNLIPVVTFVISSMLRYGPHRL